MGQAKHDERAKGDQNAKPSLSGVKRIVNRVREAEADVEEG
jgi:hypothetical protein